MSGIPPVMGNKGHGYNIFQRMAINTLGQQLCREEDGFHLSGKVQQCLLVIYQQQSTIAWEARTYVC